MQLRLLFIITSVFEPKQLYTSYIYTHTHTLYIYKLYRFLLSNSFSLRATLEKENHTAGQTSIEFIDVLLLLHVIFFFLHFDSFFPHLCCFFWRFCGFVRHLSTFGKFVAFSDIFVCFLLPFVDTMPYKSHQKSSFWGNFWVSESANLPYSALNVR